MTDSGAKSFDVQSPGGLLEDIYYPYLLPDEDGESFEALREALFSDLDPVSPYEHLLTEQIVALEWDVLRHRRFRDSLLRAEFRDQAMGVFQKGEVGRVCENERQSHPEKLAHDLVSSDASARVAAMTALSEREVAPEEIVAKAYKALAKHLEVHERQIADIEARRRRLRDDFDRVKSVRVRQVEDAEVLEE